MAWKCHYRAKPDICDSPPLSESGGLSQLADNGGWTDTHALLPGSPAFNAGDPNAEAGADGVPFYDQRGFPFDRISGGRIDIGAFEAQVALPALLGDYNHNGKVDAADYTMWRDALGDEVDFYAEADGSGNGIIDEDDFLVWRSHYGNTLPEAGGGAAAATLRLADVVPRAADMPRMLPAQRERLLAKFRAPQVEEVTQHEEAASPADSPVPFFHLQSQAPLLGLRPPPAVLSSPLAASDSRLDELLLSRFAAPTEEAGVPDQNEFDLAQDDSAAEQEVEPSAVALDAALEILATESGYGL